MLFEAIFVAFLLANNPHPIDGGGHRYSSSYSVKETSKVTLRNEGKSETTETASIKLVDVAVSVHQRAHTRCPSPPKLSGGHSEVISRFLIHGFYVFVSSQAP